MALIKCTECGKEVSSTANKCPHCGTWAPSGKGKAVIGVVVVCVILFALLSLTAEKDIAPAPKEQAQPTSTYKEPEVAGVYSPQHKKVQDIFRSKQEPLAKDAIWTAKEIFKVGVINDGTSKNGYADYVCQVLYSEGFKGRWIYVQIVDIVKLQKNGEWEKIGEAQCK